MKKLISVLCTLAMVCGLATTAMAEGNGSITLDADYYASDWETAQDKVLTTGDLVYLYINANDLPGADKITTECKQFSNVSLKVTYDEEAITPYKENGVYSHIETTDFKAKYNKPNQNVPKDSTEGIITTGSVATFSNTAEPGYTPDGITTLILNGAEAGFTLNGNFITLYFEVVDTTKDPNVNIEVTAYDNYDESASVYPATEGIKLEGIGTVEPAYTVATESKVGDVVNDYYTKGFKATVAATEATTIGNIGFEISCAGKEAKASDSWKDISIFANASASFAINVINIPEEVEASNLTIAWDVDGETYGETTAE